MLLKYAIQVSKQLRANLREGFIDNKKIIGTWRKIFTMIHDELMKKATDTITNRSSFVDFLGDNYPKTGIFQTVWGIFNQEK